MADHPGRIGRYRVVGHLATGGMAEIFLGNVIVPSGIERPVVIERVLPSLAKKEALVEMFLDESRVAARVQHANVLPEVESDRRRRRLRGHGRALAGHLRGRGRRRHVTHRLRLT